jgi:ppGpp synthetase/RelA/SpoT-type nucleotidyltranferase/metallophosphoesterase superfamily enzyme
MFTILHVSDVHFGIVDDLGEQGRITDTLITAAHDCGTRPDICIFSGDLAHSGESEQLKKGEEWLSRLNRWGVDLFIVPGNHDINRKNAQSQLLRHIAASRENYKGAPASLKWPHLEEFFSWLDTAKRRLPLRGEWKSPFGYYYEKDGLELPVHIIGLNSAIASCNDDDRGNLVIDVKTTNEFLSVSNRRPGLIIAIGHHPIDQLVEWNRNEIRTIVSQQTGAHLYLHGHAHDQAGRAESDSSGQRLTTLAAGAAYQGSQWPQHFAFYELDFSADEIRTKAYIYAKNAGKWIPDASKSIALPWRAPANTQSAQKKQNARPLATELGKPDSRIPTGIHAEPQLPDEDLKRVQIENEALKYREAADKIRDKVTQFIEDSENIGSVLYSCTSRIKRSERIIEKVLKGDSQGVKDLNDVCGVRLVTYFSSDIPLVVREMLRAVEDDGPPNSPFRRGRPVHVRIHNSRHENDPLSISKAVKEVARNSPIKPEIEERAPETNYSSVHLIIWAPVQPAPIHKIEEMPVEIQIRSAPEELWGAIDHRLRYGSQRGGTGVLWQRHLNVLKALVDGLMQYVDEIKRLSEEDKITPPGEIKEARTIDPPDAELERLRELPPDIYSRVVDAYRYWTRSDASALSGGNSGLFRLAADKFAALLVDFSGEAITDKTLAEEFRYIAQAEQAYLLMYTGDIDDLNNSATLYERILSDRRDDGTAHFRLGEVRRRQHSHSRDARDIEASRDLLQRAIEIAETGKDKRVNRNNWIYDSIRLALALTNWRIFEDQSLPEEARRKALSDALSLAKSVVDDPAEASARTHLRAINDLLYYSWEERDKFNGKTVNDKEFAKLAEELKGKVPIPSTRYEHVDTLQRAFKYLGRQKDMASFAIQVRDSLEKSASNRHPDLKLPPDKQSFYWTMSLGRTLNLDEQDALAFAQDIINTSG